MKHKTPNLFGFTLLEVVIVITIFLIMALVLINFFVNSNSTFVYERGYISTSQESGAVMSALGALLLPADAVLANHTFTSGTYQSATSTLVLEIPSVDSTGSIVSGKYDYAVFYIGTGTVYRIIEPDATSARTSGKKILSSTINTMTFTYNDPNFSLVRSIGVDLVTQVNTKKATAQSHLYQFFYMRNAPQP